MFSRFTKFTRKNEYGIVEKTLLGGTFCGSGYGFYRSYVESRDLPYSESIVNTIGGAFFGGYIGLLAAVTLPITLPVAVCTTTFRVADDIIHKKNHNSYEIVLYKNLKMNIEDIFD